MEERQLAVKTILGTIYLCAHKNALTYASKKKKKGIPVVDSQCIQGEILEKAQKEITSYLSGKTIRFSIPLDLKGTDFQKKVWNELLKIPYGETRSYSDIAKAIKSPKAVRAVGSANAKNPIWIVVPCHRVIATNGKLSGYAGGISMKKNLLKTEGIIS